MEDIQGGVKSSGEKKSSKKQKAKWGAVVAVLITLLVTIISGIDGKAISGCANAFFVSKAASYSKVVVPDAGVTPTPTVPVASPQEIVPAIGTLLDMVSKRLDAIESVIPGLSNSDADKGEKLVVIKGELESVRTIILSVESSLKEYRTDFVNFLDRYNTNEKNLNELLTHIRERLSFLEGKVDTLSKGR